MSEQRSQQSVPIARMLASMLLREALENKEQPSTPEELLSHMKANVQYGWKGKDGKTRKGNEGTDREFTQQYRLQHPDEMRKTGVGVCWDQVEYQREHFKRMGIPHKTFFMTLNKGKFNKPSHTLLAYKEGKKWNHFENSDASNRGIHPHDSIEDLKNTMEKRMKKQHGDGDFHWKEYNQPKPGTTEREYYNDIAGLPLYAPRAKKGKLQESTDSAIQDTVKWVGKNLRPLKFEEKNRVFLKRNAEQILQDKTASGCIDHAVAASAILHSKGINSKIIHGVRHDPKGSMGQGHAFLEIKADGDNKHLLDVSRGKLYKNYDAANSNLPDRYIKQFEGHPTEHGLDTMPKLLQSMKQFEKSKLYRAGYVDPGYGGEDVRNGIQESTSPLVSYVPADAYDDIKKHGLLSGKLLLQHPDLLAKAAKGRKQSTKKLQDALTSYLADPRQRDAHTGINAMFHSPPDLSKLIDKHPLHTMNLRPVRIDIDALRKAEKARFYGMELNPWATRTKDNPRHKFLSAREFKALRAKTPEEIWSTYNDDEGAGRYAPDVPHVAIHTKSGKIDPRYLKFDEAIDQVLSGKVRPNFVLQQLVESQTFTREVDGKTVVNADVNKLFSVVHGRTPEEVAIDSLRGAFRSKRSGFSNSRYSAADLSYPIFLTQDNWIADGRHRVLKLKDQGKKTVQAIRLTPEDLLAAKVEESALPVPPRRQQTNYTCGTASLEAAFEHFNIEPLPEMKMAKVLGTTKEDGTSLPAMLKLSRLAGLKASIHQGLTVQDLRQLIDNDILPIVAYQSWPGQDDQHSDDWKDANDNGHYSVVKGFDEDDIILMDPSVKGGYRRLSAEEFDRLWHDKDSSSKPPRILTRTALLLSQDA